MKTQCPECGASYTVDESATGKRATCPACKAAFQVVAAADDAAPQDEEPEVPVLKRRTWKEAMAQQAVDVPEKVLEYRAAEQHERLEVAARADRRINIPIVTTERFERDGYVSGDTVGFVASRRLMRTGMVRLGIPTPIGSVSFAWDTGSKAIYKAMEDALLDDIREQAERLGGSAIVALRLQFSEIEWDMAVFLTGFAQGTAVRTAVPND